MRNGTKGKCIHCQGRVKSGGDRHAIGRCARALNEDGTVRLKIRKRKAKRQASMPQRGAPVAGLHKKDDDEKDKKE